MEDLESSEKGKLPPPTVKEAVPWWGEWKNVEGSERLVYAEERIDAKKPGAA